MDNFFDILIILFFVVSLLAPLFKKKKQGPNYENPNMQREREVETESDSGESTDDLLGELEELFGKKKQPQTQMDTEHTPVITKPEPVQRESVKRESGIDYDMSRTYDSAPSLETEIEKRKREIEKINRETHDIIASTAKARKEAGRLRSDSQFSKQDKAESALVKKSSPEYSRESLITNLKNPQTLKDYIVISELIGKPKALKHSR